MSRYFVTCARGVEEITEKELLILGAQKTECAAGGVYFEGDQTLLYDAHLWLRTGNRIFLPLRTFPCRNPDDLYSNMLKFKWETFLNEKKTFAVDCTLSGRLNPALSHSHYAKLRIKDAIVDRLREKTGSRPDVNLENPDLRVLVYIRDGLGTLNLDATGSSLHERGYRSPNAQAPLKETLAASILLLSEWNPETTLIDPMCGSGTLLAEAAMMASHFAPGLMRKKFLFMNWPDFYLPRWEQCVQKAENAKCDIGEGKLWGFDKNREAISQSRFAMEKIKMQNAVSLQQRRFEDFQLPEGIAPGMIVVNPPYGERLGEIEELKQLYQTMGNTFKHKLKGWKAVVFTGNKELAKSIGLKAKKFPLYNGAIDSRVLVMDLY